MNFLLGNLGIGEEQLVINHMQQQLSYTCYSKIIPIQEALFPHMIIRKDKIVFIGLMEIKNIDFEFLNLKIQILYFRAC